MTYEKAYEMLYDMGQEHLLTFYDELNDVEKQDLIEQIESIDYTVLERLDIDNDVEIMRGEIEPLLGTITIEDIEKKSDEYLETGLDAIRNGKVAAVLLAGGQGTRLGSDKPKGMFNIGVDKELYIFQCLINNLMEIVDRAGAWIPLCVMTSEKNNDDTIEFFADHDYFGYNSEYVNFFIQDRAPCVDFRGRILLDTKSKIAFSPNGNGGWFSSLMRSGLCSKLISQGVEWFNVFSVDNVLQKIADPKFIGAVICNGMQSGSKVVAKTNPYEKVGAMCLEDGKPSIIEYYELTVDMANQKLDDGELAYKYGVILNYLFSADKLMQIADRELPVHIVEKKIPYLDENGEYIEPEKTNGYKFETLILDMIHMHDSCLPYEVERNKEFAPVKNAKGVDSVDTARALLRENGVEI